MAADVTTAAPPTTDAPTTATSGFAQTDTPSGATLAGWRAALPPELASEKAWDDIKGDTWEQAGPVIAKRFIDAHKLVGNAVKIPGPEAPPEEHARFRARMGVPESPDKYGVQLPVLPETLGGWDQAKVNHALARFHTAGMTPAQVNDAIGLYAEMVVEAHDAKLAADAKTVRDAEATLARKWGPPSGPTFRRNLGLAQKALDAFLPGDNPLRGIIEGKGNDPHLVEFLALAGERMLEDGAIEGAEYESMTQEAVQAKIDAIFADKTHPAHDPNHPGHAAALEQMLELYRKLPGGREVILERK